MSWWLRTRWVPPTAVVAVGAALLGWSWFARTEGWLSGVLVNVGTTLLLFSPLLLAARQIENRLDDVRAKQVEIRERQDEAAASVAVLARSTRGAA